MLDHNSLPISSAYAHRRALNTAIELVQRAGAMLLEIHREGPQRIHSKSSQVDLVTEADVASQRLIIETLQARFPDHGILAEEDGGDFEGAGGALWLIDPLDGTTNFASRFPIFAVSIALWLDGQPELGAVHDVVRERTYWGARGQGAWIDLERRLAVSTVADLSQSLLATGFPYSRATDADNNLAEFAYLMLRTRGVRRAGAAALDLTWVADGRCDGYWETQTAPWDWGAGVLLVTEAGGVVSNYAGQPWAMGQHQIVAATPRLHPLLLEAIQAARLQAGLTNA